MKEYLIPVIAALICGALGAVSARVIAHFGCG
jgi:hypothetical protein